MLPSGDASNQLVLGTDNLLYVPKASRGCVWLPANVVNNNPTANTLQDVTGLQFAVSAGGTYRFRFVIPFSAAAATTGSRWTLNGPATSLLRWRNRYTLTPTTETVGTQSAYGSPAAANASSAVGDANLAILDGVLTASADGNVVARFASEVASSAITARAGAYVEWERA